MDGGLFVAHQHMFDLFLLEQFIIDRQDGPAGIAKDDIHALINQGLYDHFCAGHGFAHCSGVLSVSLHRA